MNHLNIILPFISCIGTMINSISIVFLVKWARQHDIDITILRVQLLRIYDPEKMKFGALDRAQEKTNAN
jgi:hypothetical protein